MGYVWNRISLEGLDVEDRERRGIKKNSLVPVTLKFPGLKCIAYRNEDDLTIATLSCSNFPLFLREPSHSRQGPSGYMLLASLGCSRPSF
jgi:hypothetical protein